MVLDRNTRSLSKFSMKAGLGSLDKCSDLHKECSTSRFCVHMSESSLFNQFGHFQGMQFQLAQAGIEIEAAHLLTYNAARKKGEVKNFTKEATVTEFYSLRGSREVQGMDGPLTTCLLSLGYDVRSHVNTSN